MTVDRAASVKDGTLRWQMRKSSSFLSGEKGDEKMKKS